MPPELRSAKTILLHPPLRSDVRQSSAMKTKKGPCSPKQEPFSFSCPADEMIQQSETHSLYYLSGYPQVDLSVSPRHGSISSATGRHWPRANTISDSRWNRSRCGTSLQARPTLPTTSPPLQLPQTPPPPSQLNSAIDNYSPPAATFTLHVSGGTNYACTLLHAFHHKYQGILSHPFSSYRRCRAAST